MLAARRQNLRPRRPAFASSYVFVWTHGSWMWSRFAVGFLLCAIYAKTRSLWVCSVAHYVHNVALFTAAVLAGALR